MVVKHILMAAVLSFSVMLDLPAQKTVDVLPLYTADNALYQYTGRIDFTHPQTPRYWMPGIYVQAKFTGTRCTVLVNDEMAYGKSHNYIEIAVDDKPPIRLKLAGRQNEIDTVKGLTNGDHTITIAKNTESGVGYIEFVGLKCRSLKRLPAKPARAIECIGNSITCGTGSDLLAIPCGKGVWEDQHNAYMSYGAVTARNLQAQYCLSAVSGIGLMHSCCRLQITMPQVFDKVNMRADSIAWNFKNYTPDVVTICLGQNDGIQDSTAFCSRYITFIQQVRTQYSAADIVCLTSPMADERLATAMKKFLTAIVAACNSQGDKKVSSFFFSKQFHHGCDGHPDLAEHQQIAAELTAYLKQLKGW